MKIRVNRKFRFFLAISLAMFGVVVFSFFSLPWLLISSLPTDAAQLPSADVIIHWNSTPRSQSDDWVAELYQKGKAKQIVCVSTPISWDIYPADYARQHLIAMGVPAENILTLHLGPEPCAAPNIKRVAEYVKSQRWQSAIGVTGPINSSSRMQKYFQHQGIKLALTYYQKDRDELTNDWWKTHWKVQAMSEAVMVGILDSAYSECW